MSFQFELTSGDQSGDQSGMNQKQTPSTTVSPEVMPEVFRPETPMFIALYTMTLTLVRTDGQLLHRLIDKLLAPNKVFDVSDFRRLFSSTTKDGLPQYRSARQPVRLAESQVLR